MAKQFSSPFVSRLFRRAMFVLVSLFVLAGGAFLMNRGNADSVTGITAFQAADMASRSVVKELESADKDDPIARLSGNCSDGMLSGENSSGKYSVVFRNAADRPLECSEKIGDAVAIEVTGIFGSERRIIRVAVAQSDPTSGEANSYLTTGSESQYKRGALGIGGLLKTYLGINANNQRITNVASPENSSDAATKAYVDAQGGGGGGGSSCGGGGVTGGCIVAQDWSVPFEFWGSGCGESFRNMASNGHDNNLCTRAAANGYSCGISGIMMPPSSGDTGGRAYQSLPQFYCSCVKI